MSATVIKPWVFVITSASELVIVFKHFQWTEEIYFFDREKYIMSLLMMVTWTVRAAITKYRGLDGLKTTEMHFSQFW